jgi:hypothetical protein
MIVVSFIILRRSERQRAGPGVAGKAMDIFSSLWAAARGRFAGNAAKAVS